MHPIDHRLVLAGRVRPSKGHWEAVGAVAELRARGLRVVLDVAGDGELEALRAHATALGVDEHVVLHGRGHDVEAFLDAADVALTPSRCEAFGRVTAEAQLRGVPVVGAASGGTAELLAGGRGLTHAPGDARGLADAVERLLRNDALRLATARAGWEHARMTLTPERQTAAWLALLDAAAGTARGRRGGPGEGRSAAREPALATSVAERSRSRPLHSSSSTAPPPTAPPAATHAVLHTAAPPVPHALRPTR